MKRLIFVLLGAVFICIAVFALGGRSRAPRATPVVEADPTRTPAPARPTTIPRGYVSRALLGDKWPLTVEEGTIVCDRSAILFRDPAGQLYAVNGTAQTLRGSKGWRDIHDIDVPDPVTQGTIISLQPLLDVGLELCR